MLLNCGCSCGVTKVNRYYSMQHFSVPLAGRSGSDVLRVNRSSSKSYQIKERQTARAL